MKTNSHFRLFASPCRLLLVSLLLLIGGGFSMFAQQCCPLVYNPPCFPTSACSGFDIQKVVVKNLYDDRFNQYASNEWIPNAQQPCGSTSQGYTSYLTDPLNSKLNNRFVFRFGNTYRMDVKMARNMGLSAWIDFNGDRDYDDAGEQIFSFIPGTNDVKNIVFAIPAGTIENYTTMRIRSSSNVWIAPQQLASNQWCMSVQFGETEDYPVFIDRYCIPNINGSLDANNLSFGGLNLFLNESMNYSGFYPYISSESSQKANVVSGSTYNLTMNYYRGPAYWWDMKLRVWIDYNNNTDFNDPGEMVLEAASFNGAFGPVPITIPSSTLYVGERRMRLIIGFQNDLSCGHLQAIEGMVLDIRVQISPNMGTLASGNANMCPPANPSPISFSALPSGSVNYNWYFQDGVIAQPIDPPTQPSPWTFIQTANPITGATYSTYDPPAGLNTTRTYACYVTPKFAGSSPSGWAQGVRQIRVKSGYCLGRMGVDNPDEETEDLREVSVSQNIPNPFTTETSIPCFIPEGTQSASLEVFGLDGRKVQQIKLSTTGEQNVKIESRMLPANGMYLYTLVLDGQKQPMQRMVLAK